MARPISISARFARMPWSAVMVMTLLCCLGFLMLYSAAEGQLEPWALRQLIRFVLMFPVMLAIAVTPIQFWLRGSYVFYGIVVLLLLAVDVAGTTAGGAQRWLRVGPLNIQPSEITKLCVVLVLARYFNGRSYVDIGRPLLLLVPIILVTIPALFILRQPNLGTTLIICMVSATLFFASGLRWWKIIAVFVCVIAALPLVWQHMHDYQQRRVLTFIDPERDPLGDGYNIMQSKIAIGSGGVFGKGLLNGSQSQLSFLPEKQTDFIFTMLTEEFGLIGGFAVITLFCVLMLYGYYVTYISRSQFGRLVALGITSILFFQMFVNIGMVMGLLPIVGVPLPFLSYGGTIMIVIMLGFGLLLNAHIHSDVALDREQ
jgi:rod shape determining protein RodA